MLFTFYRNGSSMRFHYRFYISQPQTKTCFGLCQCTSSTVKLIENIFYFSRRYTRAIICYRYTQTTFHIIYIVCYSHACSRVFNGILHQIILAVTSTTLMLLVSYAVFDVQLSINAWLPLFIVLDVFTFVGIGMILTRLVREAQSASSAANAIMFPMMFLSGSFFPLEMMPDFLQKFAKVLPLYYLNEGLRAAMVFQDNGTALSNASTIGAVAAVVFILGITVTRWEEGK